MLYIVSLCPGIPQRSKRTRKDATVEETEFGPSECEQVCCVVKQFQINYRSSYCFVLFIIFVSELKSLVKLPTKLLYAASTIGRYNSELAQPVSDRLSVGTVALVAGRRRPRARRRRACATRRPWAPRPPATSTTRAPRPRPSCTTRTPPATYRATTVTVHTLYIMSHRTTQTHAHYNTTLHYNSLCRLYCNITMRQKRK